MNGGGPPRPLPFGLEEKLHFTHALAEWALGFDVAVIAQKHLDKAADALADALGVAIAGSTTDTSTILRAAHSGLGAGPSAGPGAIIGGGASTDAGIAAKLNGTAMHALDFDDISHPGYAHVTTVVLPTLLGHPDSGIGGDRVTTSYLLGLETINRLGSLLNFDHYGKGWHATATLGVLGGTVALGVAQGLSRYQLAQALSIAASSSSGVRANFGSQTKPLHAGHAAQRAVEAIQLAVRGFTAGEDALNGDHGLIPALTGRKLATAEVEETLSGPLWSMESSEGMALKPFPSCGATHAPIDGIITLLKDIPLDEIEAIRVGVPTLTTHALIYPDPKTGLQGKFSLQYCVATAALSGHVGLEDFADSRIADPARRALMPKISMELDASISDFPEPIAIVTASLVGGGTRTVTVNPPPGKGDRWPSAEARRRKFADCMRFAGWPDEESWRTVQSFTSGGSLGALREFYSTRI